MNTENKNIKDIEFVAFDIETTGLDSGHDRILELAAVKFNTNGILDKFETLVNPGINIRSDRRFTDVHNITGGMVEGKPRIKEILPQFLDFLGEDTVGVSHNAGFDVGFIAHSMYRNKIIRKGTIILDTSRLTPKLFPDSPDFALDTIVWYLKIKSKPNHRALGDCIACQNVFLCCLKEIDTELNFTLPKLIEVNGKPITFNSCYSMGDYY